MGFADLVKKASIKKKASKGIVGYKKVINDKRITIVKSLNRQGEILSIFVRIYDEQFRKMLKDCYANLIVKDNKLCLIGLSQDEMNVILKSEGKALLINEGQTRELTPLNGETITVSVERKNYDKMFGHKVKENQDCSFFKIPVKTRKKGNYSKYSKAFLRFVASNVPVFIQMEEKGKIPALLGEEIVTSISYKTTNKNEKGHYETLEMPVTVIALDLQIVPKYLKRADEAIEDIIAEYQDKTIVVDENDNEDNEINNEVEEDDDTDIDDSDDDSDDDDEV